MKNKKLIEELVRTSIQEQVDFIEHLNKELEKARAALKELIENEKDEGE